MAGSSITRVIRRAHRSGLALVVAVPAWLGVGGVDVTAAGRPAAEAPVDPQAASGVYRATGDGRRWAIEVTPDGSVVVFALDRWNCVAPGTLIASGQWQGDAFSVLTPYYDLAPGAEGEAPRCSVALEGSLDRIVIVDDRSIDWCTEGGCLRMVRPVRYRVQLSAWIPHTVIADPYLPSPVSGLPAELVDLSPASLADCLGAELIESVVYGQDHVGLVEPLLATVTVELVLHEDDRVEVVSSDVAPMSVARTVAGFGPDDALVECAQAVTRSGAAVGRVTTMGNVVVLQLHAGLGIVPARRAEIDASEASVLRRIGCDGVAVSCDPQAQALGTGQIDGWVVLSVADDGQLHIGTATDAFPSFGLTIAMNDRDVMSTVLQDSSCYETIGPAGVVNMVELLHTREERGRGALGDWPDDTCEPATLSGETLPSELFSPARSPLATFLLGVRYAAASP
jgi:hypothetical protein